MFEMSMKNRQETVEFIASLLITGIILFAFYLFLTLLLRITFQ